MNEYMKVAMDLAEENLKTNAGGPFGACIVKDGKIIGKSSNKVLQEQDPTCHAEIMAIREACKTIGSFDLSGCEIYTTCYPCPMCLSAIIWANIKKIYYGNTKEDADKIGFRDDFIYKYFDSLSEEVEDESILDMVCIDREETIKTFDKYKDKEDKTIY